MEKWPPDFTLRKSTKAKRASILIHRSHLIEVVVPARTKVFDPILLLNQHKAWVIRQLSKVPVPVQEAKAPESIVFPAFDREYQVNYGHRQGSRLLLRENDSLIDISGDYQNNQKLRNRLSRWLNGKAEELLFPMTDSLNRLHGFTAKTFKARLMNTRWGSCSREGKITLNSQLLFLPLTLIQHVICHELCHTKIMSHGPNFWRLLNKVDPHTPENNKKLSGGREYIPLYWLSR